MALVQNGRWDIRTLVERPQPMRRSDIAATASTHRQGTARAPAHAINHVLGVDQAGDHVLGDGCSDRETA
jgi:hypothetical protein